MALPHYKLHTLDNTTLPPHDIFPVLLAPAEPPQKWSRLKQFIRSKKLLIALEIISLAAGAALLWLLLDPTIKTPLPVYWLTPAVILGACLVFFLIVAFVKNRATTSHPVVPEPSDELPEQLPARAPRPTTLALMAQLDQPPAVVMAFEQWTSEPYVELLDDSIVTEVFDDDLIAPDHMIICVKVPEE